MARIDLEINGNTRLLGILGQRIGYTKSPAIHNFSAQLLAKNTIYVPFNLEHRQVKRFMESFWDLGGVGLNVTTPHKELIASMVPDSQLGSVNTVYRGADGWQVASTDAEGLAMAVSHMGLNFRGFTRFVILGSGGVVKAILAYIAENFESLPEVVVLRRDRKRDESLRQGLPDTFKVAFEEFSPQHFKQLVSGGAGETLVIQATSAPHQGDNLARFAEGIKDFNGALVDVVYGAPSALISTARQRGIPYQDGLPMLIEQARVAQRYWWGAAAPYNAIYSFLTGAEPEAQND